MNNKTSPGVVSCLALAATVCAGVALTLPAMAAPREEIISVPRIRPTPADANIARSIDIVAGKSVMIDLPRDAKEVFVAAPDIANAVVRTPRKIYIIGLKAGSTSVLVSDSDGRQIMALDVGVSKEMTRELSILRDVLRQALPTSKIEVRGTGQNIVLSGTVDSLLDAQRAVDVASNLVGKGGGSIFAMESGGAVVNALNVRGKDQVMLKVTVAEVSRLVIKQLGVNFDGSWQVGGNTLRAIVENPFMIQKQSLSSTGISGTGNFPTLKAMERNGVLRTLAEPTLTAVSGEAAKFLAGGEIPVPTEEACPDTSITSSLRCGYKFTYKPIGVSLTFTPLVMSENRISVRVSTEVTEIDPDNQIAGQRANFPAFRTRRAETTVELPSGGVMAMAGMVMTQSKQGVLGVPALLNIPIIGSLFRSRDYQRNETELMILVQPFIAKPSRPGEIARPDDGYADASDPSAMFMNRFNRATGQGTVSPNPFRGKVGFINE